MRAAFLVPTVLAVGCGPPPAPKELDELCGYLFGHFGEEDTAAMEVGLLNLDAWLNAHLEDSLDGYSITSLSQATVDALDDRTRNTEDMIGAVVSTTSGFEPYALGLPQLLDDQTEVFPDAHVTYERTYLTDTRCWRELKCDFAEVENRIEDDYPIIESVRTHNHGEYHWYETERGLTWVQRTWFIEPAEDDVDWFEIRDQYYLNVLLPTDTGTLTLQSMWVEAYWGDLPVSEDVAKNLLISQMQNVYAQLDEYVTTHGAAAPPEGCSAVGDGRRAALGLALTGLAFLLRRRR